jgi:hypothetical protein
LVCNREASIPAAYEHQDVAECDQKAEAEDEDEDEDELFKGAVGTLSNGGSHHSGASSSSRFEVPLVEGSFDADFVKSFRADAAFELLLDARESYTGHKEVVSAGLWAWIVNPADKELRRNVMRSAMLHQLQRAEEKALKNRRKTSVADFDARHVHLSPKFFSEIYYPLGGISGIRATPSSQLLKARIERRRRQIMDVISLARIYHAVVEQSSGSMPSKQGAIDVSKWMKSDSTEAWDDDVRVRSEGSIVNAWRSRRPSVALVYTSSFIQLGTSTIEDRLCEGDFTVRLERDVLEEWLAKARYFVNRVLSKSTDQTTFRQNLASLPDGPESPIPSPPLTEKAEDNLKKRFGPKI